MKLKHLFTSLFATALLCGCSSDEPAGNTEPGVTPSGEPQFLTVNLVTNGETASRSRGEGEQNSGDPTINDEGDKATYEEGLAKENKVNSIRFYFFKGGNSFNVNGDKNYIDHTPVYVDAPADADKPNVEKVLRAMLILTLSNPSQKPETMVAIANPTGLGTEAISLADLKKKCGNYATNITAGTFVMSNSTYAVGNTETIEINVEGNIEDSQADALANPVNVYVERTVAKVRVTCGDLTVDKTLNADTENEIKLYDPSSDSEEKYGDEKIYVKFLGWNVTATADKSRLIKKINTGWSGTLLGDFGPWNWPDYSRSFWAFNVNSDDNDVALGYQYGAFQATPEGKTNNDNLFQAQAQTGFDKTTNYVYLNENASDTLSTGSGAATPSKVIIAAQLVNGNGDAIEFAEYHSERMTVSDLTTRFANLLDFYKKETKDNKTTYTKIAPADLVIKTAMEANEASTTGTGRYKVYVQLSDDAANEKYWYPSADESQSEDKALTVAQINQELKSLGSAKVWKNGYTYYYFDIEHGSKNGVVRNHIYDANITSLVGLGTPVYNPDEIIYPEKPKDESYTYLAARIKILSWRVVNNDVPLVW